MKNPINLFREASYESQIMQLIGLIGLVRICIALILDLLRETINWSELVVDSALLAVFLTICLLALYVKISKVPIAIGLMLMILLALNFLQFDGVRGFTEFNYLVGFVLIAMMYTGNTKLYLVLIMLTLLGAMLLANILVPSFQELFQIHEQTKPDDFVFALVGLTALTFYFKYAMDLERKKLSIQNTVLQQSLQQTKSQNDLLLNQKHELQTAQQNLEKEVQARSAHVQNQNHAIQQYILYNTTELQEPLERLKRNSAQLHQNNLLSDMLRLSIAELEVVTKNLSQSLEKDHDVRQY
jgi:hypothetical protein